MNTNYYLKIVYTGIVENSKHLNGYIERERKKAEKEFVEADEFFDMLTNAVNNIKNEFQFKHGKKLNNYYMNKNRDEAAPEGQKFYYPKELPDINSIGLPLLTLTGGKYIGHLYLNQVEYFEGKIDEVKNSLLEVLANVSNGNNDEFDLKKYDLTTNNVSPYFPKPKLVGNEYCIYEGATGNNRFQYFKVSKKTNGGKLCKQFIEKYYLKNEYRHEYYADAQKLIEACKIDAIDKMNGLDAYLKYWNDCYTEADKLMQNIYSIQHFEALKEWYGLRFEKYVQANENVYLNNDVKKADIERWKDEVAKEVKAFLQQSVRKDGRKYSAITSVQANELIKFYQWIIVKQDGIRIAVSDETRQALQIALFKIKDLEKIYDKELKSLEGYLLNKGYIIPKDFTEFIFWLLIEKYKQDTFFPLPEISDKDFLEYSRFRENKLGSIEKKEIKNLNTESNENKLTIPAYAIMHVYLALSNGKAVTQQNKHKLAKRYGLKNGDQLRNEFTKYQNDAKRLDLNTSNKKSADTHLKRFKTILPLLEAENSAAYEKAKEDLKQLEILYNKHH